MNIPLMRRFYYLFWRSKRSQTGKDYTGSRAFQLTDQQGTCQSPGHLETHGGWVQLLRPSRESTKNNDNEQQNNFFWFIHTIARNDTAKIVITRCTMTAQNFYLVFCNFLEYTVYDHTYFVRPFVSLSTNI